MTENRRTSDGALQPFALTAVAGRVDPWQARGTIPGSAAPQAAAQATLSGGPAPDLLASPKVADVVDAADAFLATPTDEQRATRPASNSVATPRRPLDELFPVGPHVCNGAPSTVASKPGSRVEAALKVAQVALGEEGFSRYQEVRAADDAFAKGRGGRARGPAQKKAAIRHKSTRRCAGRGGPAAGSTSGRKTT